MQALVIHNSKNLSIYSVCTINTDWRNKATQLTFDDHNRRF